MKSKKLTSLALAAAMTATLFAGCGNKENEGSEATPTTDPGSNGGNQEPGGQDTPDGSDENDPGTPAGLPEMTKDEITLV